MLCVLSGSCDSHVQKPLANATILIILPIMSTRGKSGGWRSPTTAEFCRVLTMIAAHDAGDAAYLKLRLKKTNCIQ